MLKNPHTKPYTKPVVAKRETLQAIAAEEANANAQGNVAPVS